jgi:ribonuclease III
LADQLSHVFRNDDLRARALSHRSVGPHNNERLEFLGDAGLSYERFPRADEGELTRLRARLVSEPALADMARALDIGEQLRLGAGELKSGGFRRDSILADAFEALIAAVYLDGGWPACRDSVRALFEPRLAVAAQAEDKDAKTRLQELLQGRAQPLPVYELVGSSGADHAKVFEVECVVAGLDVRCRAQGSSRRAAEQAAATLAIPLVQERLLHA